MMDPETALAKWRCAGDISARELAVALAEALDQRDAARTERDSLFAALSVALVAT